MTRIGVEERRARLAVRQRLAGEHKARTPLEVASSLVAIHSTDAATVYLSAWARVPHFETSDLDDALYEERSLIRMLGMRRTLFVVERELVPVVDGACTRTIAARERKRLEGWVVEAGASDDPSAWLDRLGAAALEAVDARGEAFTADLTRADPLLATKLLLGRGTRWEAEVSAGSRILPLLAADGKLVRGRPRTSWTSGQYRWASARSWLGELPAEVDHRDAQAELLRRWLAAFGPATETDIRWWAGWTAREARAALTVVPHDVVDLDEGTGYVLGGDVAPTEPSEPWVALLPTLDSTTMGWKQRAWYLGPHEPTLFDRNGNAGPTVWCDGRVVGGWSQRTDGEIVYRLLEDVGADAERAVEAEAERLRDWLGGARIAPGFLPPFQRALAT